MRLCSIHLFLVAFSLLAGCSTPSSSTKETRADVFMQAGTEAIGAREYTLALRQLNEAAKIRPNSPEIWSNISIAFIGKNELGRAEDAWKKALQLDPKYTDARLNLGILYARQERFPEGEKILLEASKDLTYPRLYQVAFQLAQIYLELNRPLLAEQQLKIAVRENNSFCPAWFHLGRIQKERGDYSDAAQSMRGSVMGTCYKNPEAHYEIAELLLKARDVPQAKTKLLEIIQLFPTSEWARKSEATLHSIR